ncbi:30S ribosomal protein S1 [Candidatus Daviesbacteria bacterium]|nr:30S ribosomal protein S1 [Candidatus Daviesbacteria bacterium]
MADLLAANESAGKVITLHRGDQVDGKVISLTQNDIILDLGSKAEGLLNKKDLTPDEAAKLKVGDSLKVYVNVPENESGQAIVTLNKALTQMGKRAEGQLKKWQKFISAQKQHNSLTGTVVEINKGGLVVEVDGMRGFLPASQVSLQSLGQGEGLESLIGKVIAVTVIEIDPKNNRLIFSTRHEVSPDTATKLDKIQIGEEVVGKIAALVPFGLVVSLGGLEGVVFSQETAWEEIDLTKEFTVGQEIKAKVMGIDEDLGRVNLSIRQLVQDPLAQKLAELTADDVVKGTVADVSQQGVTVKLENGVEGFVPSSKLEGGQYSLGEQVSFLVDNVDKSKRKVNLAPLITSTKGLIYR